MGEAEEFSWGYGDAGKTINLLQFAMIQRIIDRAHERVFNESREARIERLKPLGDGSEEPTGTPSTRQLMRERNRDKA